MERDILQIKEQYLPVKDLKNTEEQRVFRESFQRLDAIRAELADGYLSFENCFLDAEAVLDSPDLPLHQKTQLLYAIYDNYFRQLSELPWRLRRTVKADRTTKQMQRAIKGKPQNVLDTNYWLRFCAVCLPPFFVGILGELVFLSLPASAPAWQYVLSFVVMLLGFAVYFVAYYAIESRRIYGGLHKWIEHRRHPKSKARPMDFFQTAKMLIPLGVSLAGALIKLL